MIASPVSVPFALLVANLAFGFGAPANGMPPRALADAFATSAPIDIRLLRIEPAPDTTLARKRPEISATFGEIVAPASVRVDVDDIDLTAASHVTARSFTTQPDRDLPPGSHTVIVTGRTPEREPFAERWTFATTDAPNANFISGLEPLDGAVLERTRFDVSGYTRPKARVRLVATSSGTSPTFSDASEDSATLDVVADKRGFFEAPFALEDRGAGLVDVRIVSTDPGGDIAVRTLRLRR